MRVVWFCLVTLISFTTWVISANAYTISPKPDIHEAITRSAKLCFKKGLAQNSKPTSCDKELAEKDSVDITWIRDSSIPLWDIRGWYRRARGYSAKFPDLEEAVRWPDDPTRQIGLRGIIKFSLNMLTECNMYLGDNPNGRNDINDGLLCNSHNGDMQFMHAQASEFGELATDTHYKIIRWATFLFEVASGKLSETELNQPYCSYFAGDDVFSKAMLPNQQAIPCETVEDPAWRLTTLFTFKCSKPIGSTACYEEVGDSRFDKARINATGALLHLIQDSYSQSHNARGSCQMNGDKVIAKIECLPISRFTTYRSQVRHADADREPIFSQSCESGGVDPILASAQMLWHIHNNSSLDAFKEDLEKVFGSSESMKKALPASLGECFGD